MLFLGWFNWVIFVGPSGFVQSSFLEGTFLQVSTTSVLIGSSAGQHRDSNGLLTAVDVNWTL